MLVDKFGVRRLKPHISTALLLGPLVVEKGVHRKFDVLRARGDAGPWARGRALVRASSTIGWKRTTGVMLSFDGDGPGGSGFGLSTTCDELHDPRDDRILSNTTWGGEAP